MLRLAEQCDTKEWYISLAEQIWRIWPPQRGYFFGRTGLSFGRKKLLPPPKKWPRNAYGGIVTRHTLHSALRANCSPAAAGLHEMKGHSDTQCKTEIRRDISNSFLRDEYFIQPIICFAKLRALCWHFHFRFVLLRGVHFVYVTLCPGHRGVYRHPGAALQAANGTQGGR